MDVHPLDNPVWYTLSHNLPQFATGTALAKRGDPSLFPFSIAALADHSAAAYNDLANLLEVDETAVLFEPVVPPLPAAFVLGDQFLATQFVCQQRTPVPESDVALLELTEADVPDMLELAELTQPGPFAGGMVALRRFVGIRQDGKLVAMAGERMQMLGYTEVSGVCTHPDWRGKGYARLLTHVIAEGIWQRGDTPFLHIAPENEAARRVYERLHFVERRTMTGFSVTRT